MKRVLVVVAHPDDEVLGCGGTIAKHVKNGDRVDLLVLGGGVGARGGASDLQARLGMLERSCALLGISSTAVHDFPDNAYDSLPRLSLVQAIEKALGHYNPEIIYTHFFGDLNIDHQVTHHALMTAARPQPSSSVKAILCCEVPSSTEWQTPSLSPFMPNYFVDIGTTLEQKNQALLAYGEELRDAPHARSMEKILSLASWRGGSIGVEFAEAFTVARILT